MHMHKIAIIGAGKIGSSIAKILHNCGDYAVTAVDNDAMQLADLAASHHVATVQVDIHDRASLKDILAKHEAVVSACSYDENTAIADIVLEVGCSYFDLTEDIATSNHIRKLADHARPGQVFMPQCGLAPGFIAILAADICKQFDRVETVKMRVGALPEFPSNQMMYNLTWSTEGLINEYCNPTHAIRDHEFVELIPLEGLESFSLDGVEYEAFNTSGGLGTLCETLQDTVENLSYKTIRYKGHQYLMDFLINGLQLGKRRQLLKEIFERSVAITQQDVVLIMVAVTGYIDDQLIQRTDSRKIYHNDMIDDHWGAIQITTASVLYAVLDLFFEKATAQRGFLKQEDIPLDTFLTNRFGKNYIASHLH